MKHLVIVISALLLAACNDKPPARTVFDTQLQARDKARAVEGKLQEAADRQRSNIEQADGTTK